MNLHTYTPHLVCIVHWTQLERACTRANRHLYLARLIAFARKGHTNVVYAVAFNNPYGDKVATGSFDKTCKLWDVATGSCFHTFKGHTAEIVCLAFNPQSTILASGSMDRTAKLWDIASGKEIGALEGHTSEIICVSFNMSGERLLTGKLQREKKQENKKKISA